MGTLKRWNGTAFKTGATVKRWDGSTFKTGGTLRRWTGSGWQPPLAPAAVSFVNAESAYATAANPTLTVPTGVVATDLLVLAISSGAAPTTTGPGTTFSGPTTSGSMRGMVRTATGFTAGDTLTVASDSGINPSSIVAAWYRGVTSVGTPTSAVKAGTVTTLTATDTTDDTTGDLIVAVFLEKSSNNVVLTAPTVTGVTNRAWRPQPNNGSGLPSAWIGDYSAPGSNKTITYPQSSANGVALQVRLRP